MKAVNADDVLKILHKYGKYIFVTDEKKYSSMVDEIANLKALKQEQKTGHWEYGYAFADGNYSKCSECKEIIKCTYPMHYCPNCGAKMVKPQESEDKE